MEEHRLKPMPEKYDTEMFNRIYSQTENLRKSLARGIDSRRFGLTHEDIVSAFNTKLLYVFTKYYGKPEGILKGHVIKALQIYKCKIMRYAYNIKNSQNIISTDLLPIEDLQDSHEERDYYYEKLMSFMKEHLSDNAFILLDLQLNPTPYILKRINPSNDGNLQQKIPDDLILDYFDLGSSEQAYKYLAHLKKEIKNAVNYARLKMKGLEEMN